jgi:hypothetical protein
VSQESFPVTNRTLQNQRTLATCIKTQILPTTAKVVKISYFLSMVITHFWIIFVIMLNLLKHLRLCYFLPQLLGRWHTLHQINEPEVNVEVIFVLHD